MSGYVRPAARAGATAIVAATGLMMLASTGQTPSGFVPASFGGPLGLFDSSALSAMNDVVQIGDGPTDANDLATLLKTAGPLTPNASGPLHANFTPGSVPNTAELSVVPSTGPDSAPTSKQSLSPKPVLDSQGRVDCSRAISCQTDPTTHVTTVTYPDGVVAIVQRINDMTLVAYKTVGEAIKDGIESLLPHVTTPLPAAGKAPTPAPVVAAAAPAPVVEIPVEIDARPEPAKIEAGPVAPSAPAVPDISASTVRPRLTITDLPSDFTPDKTTGGSDDSVSTTPSTALDAVKDAVKSAVDAVGKAIGPGASTEKSGAETKSGSDGETAAK